MVTLWDPLTNEMLHALCQPLASPTDELLYVGFAGEGGALLAHSSTAMLCWHILSVRAAPSRASVRLSNAYALECMHAFGVLSSFTRPLHVRRDLSPGCTLRPQCSVPRLILNRTRCSSL